MQTKYRPIGKYLQSIPPETRDLTLSFEEIERILLFPLPSSAHEHQAWWAFEENPGQPQKIIWQSAGWQVASVDFSRRQIRFQRITSIALKQPVAAPKPEDAQRLSEPFKPRLIPIASSMRFQIQDPAWNTIFVIPHGTILAKGQNDLYHEFMQETAKYPYHFGCYAWASVSTIYYCGSFAADYTHGQFKTNLQARIHNYLQNHRIKESGQRNTNLMVFEHLNQALIQGDIRLNTLSFEKMQFGEEIVDFSRYSQDADLVHVVEEFLIAWYRKQGQCQWNRT